MLTEIRCDIFREPILYFHKGLNVVLGDNIASNSIGKSTLLMIIDFVFGGDTYITANNDVVENNDHHEFKFSFDFSGEKLFFSKATATYKKVNICDEKYNVIRIIDNNVYTDLLKQKYNIELSYVSFRAIVSLFMRIWGKDNYDLERPLQIAKQKTKDAVTNLIKLFDKYESIKAYDEQIKELESKKQAIMDATKNKYLPSLTKSVYKKNITNIDELNRQINELKVEIQKSTLDVKELITAEILELKETKSLLVKQRDICNNRLKRTRSNISKKYSESHRQFIKLTEYFPDIDLAKLEEVEGFHDSIATILQSELKKAEKELSTKLAYLENEITKTDELITLKLKVDNLTPTYAIDKIVGLAVDIKQKEFENSIYEEKENVTIDLTNARYDLAKIKDIVTSNISSMINSKMQELNMQIHTDGRRAPSFELKDELYIFRSFDDRGTGKAYSNLIIFDLAILEITLLPLLVHDTLLFKNIENIVIERLMKIYNDQLKQTFIAIDEINKYDSETQNILTINKVIELSNSKTLFKKKWNRQE